MTVRNKNEVITNSDLKCTIALSGLYHVYDPEIGLNVVDLGLIYEVKFNEEENIIDTVMTLTTKFCPMGESIVGQVKNTLAELFAGYQVNVALVFNPAWSADRISAEGMEFLNR